MNTSDHEKLVSQVIRRSILIIVSWLVPTAPLAGVFVGLSLGLNPEDTLWAVTRILPPVFVTGGMLLPWMTTALLIRRGLRLIPGEPPERRYASGTAYLRGQGHGRVRTVHGLEQVQREIGHLVVEARLPERGQPASSGYEGEGYVIVRHPDTEVVEDALHRIVTGVRVELAESL